MFLANDIEMKRFFLAVAMMFATPIFENRERSIEARLKFGANLQDPATCL
jgi:hypothetical protein